MRIFLAGAGGAIGRRLTPLLVSNGHEVTGTTRSADKADALRALGARRGDGLLAHHLALPFDAARAVSPSTVFTRAMLRRTLPAWSGFAT